MRRQQTMWPKFGFLLLVVLQPLAIRMTAHQKIALRAAWLFFGTWLLLALTAADFPPPRGFAFVVLILLACALLVYLRVPVYLRWLPMELARGFTDEDATEQRIVFTPSTTSTGRDRGAARTAARGAQPSAIVRGRGT